MLKHAATRLRNFLVQPAVDALRRSSELAAAQPPDVCAQLQLMMTYRRAVEEGRPLPAPADVGFKAFSQTNEDGILLFIFSVVGVANRRCVEICAGDGLECNTANLIINHGWHGLLVDGDTRLVDRGVRFYAKLPQTKVFPPRFVQSWVTRSSINAVVTGNGFSGEVDLLSLDLDGIDYWIWEALDAVSPRVVVVEYQDILGPERVWTVPYADDFSWRDYPTTNGVPNLAGASLAAYVALARRKGYRLVAVNRYGYNAFFVKNGLADDLLKEILAHNCFDHPKVAEGMRERFPTVEHLPWVRLEG